MEVESLPPSQPTRGDSGQARPRGSIAMPAAERRPSRGISRPLIVLATLASVAALHLAQDILIPLVLAALLVFLLSPLVNRLEHRGFRRVPAVISLVLLTGLTIAALSYLVVGQLLDLAARLPEYRGNLRAKVADLRLPSEGALGRATNTIRDLRDELLRDENDPPRAARPQRRLLPSDGSAPAPKPSATPAPPPPTESPSATPAHTAKPVLVTIVRPATEELRDIAATTLVPILAPLGKAALVFVFVVFMLLRKEDLRDRLIHLGGQRRLTVTTRALEEAGEKVGRYLLMQLAINAIFGVLVGIGMVFIGLPNAMLWGMLAGLLRFIPYVGTWLGALPPAILSLAVSASWATPVLTAGVFLLTDLIVVNVLEPWLYGSSTGLSPVAIIVAAAFWTWLWGTAGLLLSTPLTVCLAVLGRHVPKLGFLDTLLGGKPDLPAADRYYQRLLSRDAAEAEHIAASYEKENGRPQMLAELMIPAIVTAKADFQRGEVPTETWQFLTNAVRKHTCRAADEDDAAGVHPPDVLVLPADDEGDEVAGVILCELLWPHDPSRLSYPRAAWPTKRPPSPAPAAPRPCASPTPRGRTTPTRATSSSACAPPKAPAPTPPNSSSWPASGE